MNELRLEVVQDKGFRQIRKDMDYPEVLEQLTKKEIDPYAAADLLLKKI